MKYVMADSRIDVYVEKLTIDKDGLAFECTSNIEDSIQFDDKEELEGLIKFCASISWYAKDYDDV